MGSFVAAVIAIFCFFLGFHNGGFGTGVIFALIMGGMSWAAFGWNMSPQKQPKPETLSDKSLAEQVKYEENLLNKYKNILHGNQQDEDIKIKIQEKEIYLKELLIESMKRMLLMTGKKIEDTIIPIMIRSIELMKTGLSAEDAQTQASNEFIQKRDADKSA